jgi:hypothetical protein
MMEALREEGRDSMNSLPTGGEYHPSSPLTREGYYLGQQIDPTSQKDALGGILSELQESEQLLRGAATARGDSEAPR